MRKPLKQALLRTIGLCLAAACLLGGMGSTLWANAYEPDKKTAGEITAKAAIVVYLEATANAAEGIAGADTVVYEKNPDMKLSPAAMNRVMVGLYAKKLIKEKNIDINTATGIYTEALQDNYVWGTGLTLANMELGETWTVKDLLSLSVIQTAADACVTLAYTLAGSVEGFVQGMNEMAQSLGCTGTTFVNVHGLDAVGQKTTVHDMYIMLRYAMEDAELERMLSASEYSVKPVKGGEERSWENSNYMLRASSDYYYSPVALGKTGVSDDSGKGVASVAQRDGYRYMTVVMGCPMENEDGETGTHYDNSIALYEWAFGAFTYETVVSANQPMRRAPVLYSWNTDSVTLVSRKPLTCLVPNGLDLTTVRTEIELNQPELAAPVDRDTAVGTASVYLKDGTLLGQVELVASESVPRSTLLYVWHGVTSVLTSPWLWIGLLMLVLLVVGYVALMIKQNRRRRAARNKGK
ncbi:MAG: D-alanyl-D-alanine carboxypeptidase [Clostridia bacterium]|nr:D-alanyl-D-alanine carboxypeptidase [Clostridia bacterium]